MTDPDLIRSLEGISLGQALRRSARKFSSLECFKDGQVSHRFAEFDQAVDQVATHLLATGLKPGEHVSAWVGNSIEWALLFFACGRIGTVFIPINTRYSQREVAYILRQSDSRLLVMQTNAYGKDFVSVLSDIAPDIATQSGTELALEALPMLRRVMTIGEGTPPFATDFSQAFDVEVDRERITAVEAAISPDVPLIMCYTSGTTGNPKGVLHNHRVMKQAVRVGLSLDLKTGDRILGHMPLYHVAGLYMALVPSLLVGACFVNMRQWDTGKALDLFETERITTFGGIPTHFVDLANHPSLPNRDLSSVRNAWIGGSPVMRSLFEDFKDKLHIQQLMSTYGMTENTISTTFNRLDDPIDVCCSNRAPILGPSEVKIVDVATGRECEPGQTGEIWCRGETVMMGYYKNPAATEEALTPDGWLRTGDLGDKDDRGYLCVTGRLKDMYKSGGTNVYPSEVEQILVQHPEIKLVSIIGVPDPRLGEVGFAFVQCHEGKSVTREDIQQFCRDKLASYKVPHHIHLLDELPRTSTGKIEKGKLRDMAKSIGGG